MNRTLKRPMFRMGGSTGTGIVSGLDMPRASYKDGTRLEDIRNIVTQDQSIMDELAPFKQSPIGMGTVPGFLIQTGLNLASATPRGKGLRGIISTAAESAKGPFAQFQKGVASRDATEAQLNRALVSRAIEKVDEKDEPEKLGTSREVLDVDTGNIIFATEAQIQTELSTKNPSEMKYVPVPKADKVKPVKVYDAKEGETRFVNQSEILTTTYETNDGKTKDRYVPVGNEDTLVNAYVLQDNGEFSINPKFVTKKEILENPNNFKPVEGNLEMMLKVDDIKRKNKNKSDAEIQMSSALAASKVIKRIEKDIQGGAKTGAAGETVLAITGVSGFIDSFINSEKNKNPSKFSSEYNEVKQYVNRLENDPTINARLTAFLQSPETQAAKSSIVNLAYLIAKAREPGGRFSVTDIELALRSLGESSNTENFLRGLKRTGEETLEFAIDNYKQHFDVGTLEMFPRKYDELIDNFNYFRGFEVEGDGSVNPNDLNFN